MVGSIGEESQLDKAVDVVKQHYEKDQTDEFLEPIVFGEKSRVKGL
jgi:bisphosphoglycerate-independent phosphoglycerate mutase (AlkP superfamily)